MGGSWARSKIRRSPLSSSPSAPGFAVLLFDTMTGPYKSLPPLSCVGLRSGNTTTSIPPTRPAQVLSSGRSCRKMEFFPANRSKPRPLEGPIKGRSWRPVHTLESECCRERSLPVGFKMDSGTEGPDPRSPSMRHSTAQPPCQQNSLEERDSDVAEKPLEGKEETFSSQLRESCTQRQGRDLGSLCLEAGRRGRGQGFILRWVIGNVTQPLRGL